MKRSVRACPRRCDSTARALYSAGASPARSVSWCRLQTVSLLMRTEPCTRRGRAPLAPSRGAGLIEGGTTERIRLPPPVRQHRSSLVLGGGEPRSLRLVVPIANRFSTDRLIEPKGGTTERIRLPPPVRQHRSSLVLGGGEPRSLRLVVPIANRFSTDRLIELKGRNDREDSLVLAGATAPLELGGGEADCNPFLY